MIFRDGRVAVNAKSAPRSAGSRWRKGGKGRKRALGAELRGQPVGRTLYELGAALQRLDRQPPDRTRDPERADGLAGEVAHRYCDAAHLAIELAVVEREPGPPHL